MDVSVSTTQSINPTGFSPANSVSAASSKTASSATNGNAARELIFELGLWLSGLESFTQVRHHSHGGESGQSKAAARDWAKEFYLTDSTLLRCSKLALELCKILKNRDNINSVGASSIENEADFLAGLTNAQAQSGVYEFSFNEIFDLSSVLKDTILLNQAMMRAAPLKFAEWTAWSNILADRLKQATAVQKLIAHAEREGEEFLPQTLKDLLQNKFVAVQAESDLRMVLPQIAKILKWLDVIEKMHDRDEPLKPTLLLFARINEQTQEMMSYINNRLRRFASEEDALFVMLDSTVYAASIEVRKVYNFELVGVAEIRQAPLLYAKIETAHGLLNDCFQQIVVNFAQLIEPSVEPTHLFPNFKTKLEQSLALRRDLWFIQQAVQQAEKNAQNFPLEKLHQKLTDFEKGTMRSLFYKDLETVERFIEEVLRTEGKNDLVPILHRFGAYLETLLGQVNMRTSLANYPFDYPKE